VEAGRRALAEGHTPIHFGTIFAIILITHLLRGLY
jgi:hypothetical protein